MKTWVKVAGFLVCYVIVMKAAGVLGLGATAQLLFGLAAGGCFVFAANAYTQQKKEDAEFAAQQTQLNKEKP